MFGLRERIFNAMDSIYDGKLSSMWFKESSQN